MTRTKKALASVLFAATAALSLMTALDEHATRPSPQDTHAALAIPADEHATGSEM
ncbi:hypothetical protein AB0I22_19035 [Streptomyces sp. NPDC050610]|uniref:hypothetical protein n=1 Tax=Streptomyces sp. NPDC050610 TaxID=3157097 RepID=UPI0034394A22